MSDLIHENIKKDTYGIKSVTLEEKRTVEDASDRLKVSGHKKYYYLIFNILFYKY